ncbi:oxidoreductase [Nocardia cyriacigeorgica]|uniref:Oxidoreductase n=1 Tax=Nocardia cyriacigeorgica TaxID=135487 RepID=A0A6P1D9A7_9NOCA|nr:oxidoreductase [Nocardia cyriacigeorgica]NEW41755.1 oxidoreductase [Nocardia cyriacigeorgica]NEW47077.1 oxidoreductase [Nocardia cyriacigeorgica]NEW51824.1 oxidoreductase [Nocardia cyriacigeorgica]NEW58287.1 oxidoreductase [Nocardia cyriacigeorgica]
MGLLDRFRRGARKQVKTTRGYGNDARYLAEWVRMHTGVEGFIEPKTTLTDVTAVLVAADGEWTRRVIGERGARNLARDLNIPVYDVHKTGYPQRMRDYDARRRIERQRQIERDLEDL